MPEQRKHPRVDASRIVVRIQNAERFRTLYLHDLSHGGLFVKTDKRLAVGTEATIELWPPEWKEALVLEAKVVRWQDAIGDTPTGMGMQFVDLSAEIAQRLDQLIEEYGESEEDEFVETRVANLIGDLDAARRRVAELTEEVQKLRKQAQELEQDEADLRAVTEKLATEKAAAERRAQEAQASLTKRLEDVDADRMKVVKQMDKQKGEEASLRDGLAKAERESKKMAQEIGDLRTKLEEQTAAVRLQKERADYLADQVEKRRAKERDLRKLLAAIGAGSAPPPSRPPPEPESDDVDVAPEAPAKRPPAQTETSWETSVDVTDAGGESFDDFQSRLTRSTRLLATDKLADHEPRDEAEALVTRLLQAGPTFQTLMNQVEGKMAEATLHRLLYDLHAAERLELRG
ncbi:MAG TPA: PilZ domain-containing protein [Myxococcales bacterium]|nr:PilZ domain-containing protein [Myxococcales bacterium]